MQFSVNAGGTVLSSGAVPYNSSSTQASLAGALAGSFPANSLVQVAYAQGAANFTLNTTATGVASNNALLSTSIVSGCVDGGDGENITTGCSQGWTITPGQSFAGGTNQVNSTVNDTGKATVSITAANGTTYSKQSTYVQGSSPASIALDLYNQFNGDPAATTVLRMTQPGTGGLASNVLGFTTVANGTGTSFPISLSSVTTDTTDFAAGSTSFPITASGATFTPGQNGTLYDQGTITLRVDGFTTATSPSKQVTYGQGSNAPSLAAQLAALIHNDGAFPIDASTVPGSATLHFTARAQGSDANSYVVKMSGTSTLPSSFATASFASPVVSAAMANGGPPTYSLDPSVALLTTYTYDPIGNLLQVSKDNGQQVQTYVYDGLGRMTSAATPETAGAPVKYSYKDFGGIAQKIDPRLVSGTSMPVTTTYTYDSLNRIKTITHNDNVTPDVTYTYNPPNSPNNTGGRLVTVSNGVESTDYQYDVMGRVTQCLETIGGNAYTIKYAYRADGQPGSITYPSQLKVNYSYDPIGRLQQLATGTQNILSINPSDYNAAGSPLAITYGNNVKGAFEYNKQLQLSSIAFGAAAPATPLLSLKYLYGDAANNGQIQSITDNVDATRSTSYTYDIFGRLQTAQTTDLTSTNSWKLSYVYDRYGNRLDETPTGGVAAMPSNYVVVNPATNRIQGSGVLYDTTGNMVSDGLNNNVFDAANRLTSTSPVPGLGGNPSNFAYGPDGALVNRSGTYYIYARGQVIGEYANGAPAASPSVQYVNLGGDLIANIIGEAVTFNYPDHLSTRVNADMSGNPVGTSGHFPAGEPLYHTGAPSDFQFTSYRRDANSGLDYANARFYSARLGRFISADPIMGDNRYAYVGGDSVNNIDPSGMFAVCIGNACGPNCAWFCFDLGGIFGGVGNTACPLCGETLGLPAGMKIPPQSLGSLLKDALGIPDFCDPMSPISDGCGFDSLVSDGKGTDDPWARLMERRAKFLASPQAKCKNEAHKRYQWASRGDADRVADNFKDGMKHILPPLPKKPSDAPDVAIHPVKQLKKALVDSLSGWVDDMWNSIIFLKNRENYCDTLPDGLH